MTNRRLSWSKYAVGAVFLAAAASQAKLQTLESQHTIELANSTKRYELHQRDVALRGSILSNDGQPLAKDEALYDLAVNFKNCPTASAFWLDLSAACGIPATEFSDLEATGAKTRVWSQSITQSQKLALDSVRARWRADGVSAVVAGHRTYALGASTACLVGVIRRGGMVVTPDDPKWNWAVRKFGKPKNSEPIVQDLRTGLEDSQNAVLQGHDGIRTGVTDRNGHFLPMRVENGVKRVDGKNITLTIDAELQSIATEAVKSVVTQNQAESGVAIVMDPKTGDLLAVANWPSFEPYGQDGAYGQMDAHGGLNPAYMSCLEPGSMFKILTLAKALDEKVVKMTDTFVCPGEKVVVPGTKPIKCDLHVHGRAQGKLDPIHAIAKSCNIWAATWAYKMGYDKFIGFLTELDLFKKPDIGVPGERPALFNRNDPARDLQVANVGFGQSINCTPVALIGAFSTLANKGMYQPPRLIEKIGETEIPPKPAKKVLSAESCHDVIEGMEAVFEPGATAPNLKIPGYTLAGKTGTAQKIGKKETGHVSNFVGFIPANNPRAVILVMVNKPSKQVYGALVAGPAFVTIAKAIIRKYHIAPDAPIPAKLAQKPLQQPKPARHRIKTSAELAHDA